MCDACMDRGDILSTIVPDEVRDPVATAKRRLRCYYECVSKDLAPEDFDVTDDDDEEDVFSLDDW